MITNRYKEMKDRQQAEFDNFAEKYCFFAFSEDQFKQGMKKLNLTPEKDKGRLVSFYGGGFVLKEQADSMSELFKRFSEEVNAAIATDQTGDGFIFDMFTFELNNHEYSYTGDPHEAIEACGLTVEEINSNGALLAGLKKAITACGGE